MLAALQESRRDQAMWRGAPSAYFVNRLTPTTPATLKSVQIYFSTRSDGLALNAPLTVISATNPSGSSAISIASAPCFINAKEAESFCSDELFESRCQKNR